MPIPIEMRAPEAATGRAQHADSGPIPDKGEFVLAKTADG